MRRLLVLLLASLASIANAQEGGYVGLSFGSFDYEEEFIDPLLGQVSDSIDVYQIFGGFEIMDNLAIEANYSKAGDVEQSATLNIFPFGEVNYALDLDLTITTVRAVGILPREWGALIAALGYYSSETDFRESAILEFDDPFTNSGTVNDDGMAAMLGIEWRFGRFGAAYGLRLEYDWWDMDGVDASAVMLGAFYGF